ncbi:MAG: SpoIIE family protein phosphatase, partial [bacterium]
MFFATWIFSLLLFVFSSGLSGTAAFFFFLANCYLWFWIIGLFHEMRPPNELLLGLILILGSAESALLQQIYGGAPFFSQAIESPALPLKLIQIFLLTMLIIVFALILVDNSKGSKKVLIWFGLLSWIGMRTEDPFYFFLLQVILFWFLLRKTSWLENLTKVECWIYLIAVFSLFHIYPGRSLFEDVESSQFQQAELWFGLPKFLLLMFKIYLLAIMVKIPIVLVYNFASLSRKLKFSSLFQSTFPQLIQLLMLLTIFYFFVAGWQAEKVRRSIVRQVEQLISGESAASIHIYHISNFSPGATLHIRDYLPVRLSVELPDQGILTLIKARSISNVLNKDRDYFLFFKSPDSSDASSLSVVKIDPDFMDAIAQKTSVLAGSLLLAYPYEPRLWETYLYQMSFWREDQKFIIYPFGFRPQKSGAVVSAQFETDDRTTSNWASRITDALKDRHRVTIGRTIAPLINENMEQTGFFAFEILLVPSLSFFTGTLVRYLLLLLVIYTLVNVLIINRMTKFGSEINNRIVQKFKQLQSGIREISTGNLDYKVQVEGEDEFVELAARFNQMGDKLKESIEEARDKERLQQELTIARNVQLSMLPLTLPKISGYEIVAGLETANEVGGDFYDVLPLDKGRFLFAIGDVSGKSTSAAFYMAQCISLIRFSQQFTTDAREIVLRLNSYFADPQVDKQIFVTAIVGILDVRRNTVHFVRAGHTLPILIPGEESKGDIRELQSEGLGIGLERSGELFEDHLKEKSLKLSSGDTLVLYTDGLVEATRSVTQDEKEKSEMQFYGEERLHTLLKDARGKNAAKTFQTVDEDVKSFYGEKAPTDDYTLLVI